MDYHVGIPAGTTLTDWQAIDDPNVTLNPGNGMVRCTGAGAAVLFDKIDFSLHGGAYIFNGSGGCSAITVTNSNFACPITAPSFTFIQDQNGASVIVRSSNFNGRNCWSASGPAGGFAAFLAVSNAVVQYNWFNLSPQQVLDTGMSAGGSTVIDYRYNLLDDVIVFPGAHMNYLQFGGSGTAGPITVEFNTSRQASVGGAEGFQFYSNNPPATLVNPTFSHNTMIALPSGAANTMSYMVHGNCHSGSDCSTTATTISGSAVNASNYFDASGAYGAYYGGTMTASMGWTSSGNIDMTSGATIVPP